MTTPPTKFLGSPYLQDPDLTIWNGSALAVLRSLPDESVDCAATSPPFYGLRDYGVDGQIGLEETLDEWAARLVEIFAEVRRILRPEGTLWVECGDSYCANQGKSYGTEKAITGTGKGGGRADDPDTPRPTAWGGNAVTPTQHPYKPKDLLGQPWLLAFALRADGWWLRQSIIWHKPNAIPESATDRCTTNHSYVFLLSKQARYFFNADAIAEPAAWERWGDQTVPKYEGTETSSGWMQPKSKHDLLALGGRRTNGKKPRTDERRGFDNRLERADGLKNARSVWTVPTRGYPDAHFATWPEALAERIIKAGCPEGGTVLDPFLGSGTTALVARKLARRCVGIELNADYCELAARRTQQLSLEAEAVA